MPIYEKCGITPNPKPLHKPSFLALIFLISREVQSTIGTRAGVVSQAVNNQGIITQPQVVLHNWKQAICVNLLLCIAYKGHVDIVHLVVAKGTSTSTPIFQGLIQPPSADKRSTLYRVSYTQWRFPSKGMDRKRFTSRHGACRQIFSRTSNGTNGSNGDKIRSEVNIKDKNVKKKNDL